MRMTIWKSLVSNLLGYETQKVVQIHSKTVGAFFRSIQLGIILYVIFWVMIKEKGYQYLDHAVSGVTAKLKGIALVDNNEINIHNQLFDAADYVIPPQQNAAFFIMTNLVVTQGQTLSTCDESLDVYTSKCKKDSDCKKGDLFMIGGGRRTGKCIDSTQRANTRVCEIYGWCPTENDKLPEKHLISTAENFTVMLKNSIEFPRYGVKRRNVLQWMTKKFLQTCRYDPEDDKNKFCPIFRVGDILKYTQANNSDIWKYGGMVSIHIEWNCNLDYHEELCLPKYTFRRLDESESAVARGWNFRFGQHFKEDEKSRRNLIKAYGIQFFITVYGQGGKFNLLTFSMNLGSGLALLGIATVLCDMIALNVTRKRNFYRNAKVDTITLKNDLAFEEEINLNELQGEKRHSSSSYSLNSEGKSNFICHRVDVPHRLSVPTSRKKFVNYKNRKPSKISKKFTKREIDYSLRDKDFYTCLPRSIEESLRPPSYSP